jgi:hypothetical protein
MHFSFRTGECNSSFVAMNQGVLESKVTLPEVFHYVNALRRFFYKGNYHSKLEKYLDTKIQENFTNETTEKK